MPAYASLLCHFDPAITGADRLEETIRQLEGTLEAAIPTGAVVDVATRYDGPDLPQVALKTNLTPAGVVERHAGQEYLVYCIGFAPGFTYCGAVPEAIAVPRLVSPRLRVPAGSVGIAGRQTGIYPLSSPGGWHLIGRSSVRLFLPDSDPPSLFRTGDRVKFFPVPE